MSNLFIIIAFWWLAVLNVSGQVYSGKSNALDVQVLDQEVTEKTAKPIVKWVYPAETLETVDKDEINLKLGISSSTPVVKVTLMVNNQVVQVFEDFTQADPGYLFDAWVERTISLQTGSNDILLIVQNDLGALKHQRKIELVSSPSLHRNHALIFAVDEYDNWEDLVGPVRDAEKIARVMESKGYQLEIVRNSTTYDLLAKLEEYVVKEFQPHDQLYIYFAGHGSVDQSSGEGYFVCKNSVSIQNSNSTYIAYSAIKSIVNNIPAQHIFILMDAVRGQGESLASVFEYMHAQQRDTSMVSAPDGKSRLGILSGTLKYRQGPAYHAGSYLSRAFITYLNKTEPSEMPTWGDLLLEFLEVEPTPVYMEFGDHSSVNNYIFQQSNPKEN